MKLRPSPATVIAVIALVVALTGTAFAAGAFNKKQTKQVTKIATKTFNGLIGGASVKHAASADSAEKADSAGRAATAAKADEATTAAKAAEATKATEAVRATEATRAGTATDAEKLGGAAAGAYQRAVQGDCPAPSAIATIDQDGRVECTSPVRAIHLSRGDGQAAVINFSGIKFIADCQQPAIVFQNELNVDVNLNTFFLKTGTAAQSTGGTLRPNGIERFLMTPRLEGQFIFSLPDRVLTIHLHGFDGNGFCEFTGTALTAVD